MIEVSLAALFLFGTVFVFWVLYHEGRGLHLRPVGITLIASLIALAPVVVVDGSLSAFGERPPAVVRLIEPFDGIFVAITILILTFNPGLVAHGTERT